MSKDTIRQFANLLSVVLALTVNVLASALPLNGQTTGEISDRFQVFFAWLPFFINAVQRFFEIYFDDLIAK